MAWQLADLPWLPPAPHDFRQRCRTLLTDDGHAGPAVADLSRYQLDGNDLFILSQTISKLATAGRNLDPLVPLKVAILGNGTTKLWAPALAASAARHGVALSTAIAEYDQVLQEALDPVSTTNSARADAVLLALDHRGLPWYTTTLGELAAAAGLLDQIRNFYRSVRDGIAAAGKSIVIWQTLPYYPEPLLGHLDRKVEGTPRWLIDELNRWIAAESSMRGDCLLDIAALAEQVGTVEWFDPVQWNLHKLPFAQRFVPIYTDHVGRILGALRGRSRKCLVLDLDNTLWGGVIGDDGLEGIRIGQGTGEGEAFLDVQRYALALRNRGVILAVASKNEDASARLPFRQHPDMLLKESHIAAFIANWTDKATNVEAIAKQLDIGLDALVLLDDNPAERAQVRAALPAVAVPELPEDPSYYVRAIASAGYFETIAIVPEDLLRANEYAANAQRASALSESRDLGDFLQSLEMVANVAPFDALGRARIAQLINKSNQFNLTTRRYTESQVAALEREPSAFTLQTRLRDRFGDNGMICVVICHRLGAVWEIDSWVMSCRVLGRRVEALILDEIARAAIAAGASTLKGLFIPTQKNELVRDHYQKLGFSKIETPGDNSEWTLDLATYVSPSLPFKVERS